MSKRLVWFLLLSAALHLLLLWLPGFAPQSSPGATLRSAAGSGRVEVRLRVLDSSAIAAVPPAAAAPVGRGAESTPPHPADTVPEQAANEPVAATSPLPILPASLPRGFDRDAYLSGDALDVRPSPEHPIVINLDDPQGMKQDKGQAVLMIYVGIDGQVDHVDIDSADVSPEVAESLSGIFRAARMRPGIKDGQPVRARMKILVEFEVR